MPISGGMLGTLIVNMAKKGAKLTSKSIPAHSTIAQFESLSDADKEHVWEFYDASDPIAETRPLTPAERVRWQQVQKSLKAKHRLRGRPKVGKGAEVVAVSIEKGLLEQADAYAREHRLGRSEVFVLGIKRVVADKDRKGAD